MIAPSDQEILIHTFEKWQGLQAEIVDTSDCLYQFTSFPHCFFNKALFKQEITSFDQIEKLIAPFLQKNLPYTCLVPQELRTSLLDSWFSQNNFAEPVILSTMSIDLFGYKRPDRNRSIVIREVTSLADLDLHVEILREGFFIPKTIAAQYLSHIASIYNQPERSFSLFIGYLNGLPAACGCLIKGKKHAGIYHITTASLARKQGVAFEVMSTLLEEAKQASYSHAILSAMPEAESLYQKIGFKILSKFTNYSLKTYKTKI